jgi:pyruvate dehydrogenase (quinone)
MAKATAADVLVERLQDWGVAFVFGLPGDGINGIMEALRQRRDEIRFVQVRHEESAAFMACAYAKFTARWSRRSILRRRSPAAHPTGKRSP